MKEVQLRTGLQTSLGDGGVVVHLNIYLIEGLAAGSASVKGRSVERRVAYSSSSNCSSDICRMCPELVFPLQKATSDHQPEKGDSWAERSTHSR